MARAPSSRRNGAALADAPSAKPNLAPLLPALEREAARRAAARGLIDFARFSLPSYQPADHHRAIAEQLERVERGDCSRLLLIAPPRHGKSELASRRWPAWLLGRSPTTELIAASHGQDLADDLGRAVRNIVAGDAFAAVFPGVALAADSQSAARWHTAQGGGYVAAGVGASITGRGANVLLIDDPVRNRADADSALVRDRIWSWYTSTAYTRLMPRRTPAGLDVPGAVVLIATRWHEADLAGRLLAQQGAGGDRWHVVELPAIDAVGEALWPERFPLDALERIRTAIGPRDWSALYQGRPAPEEGEYFRRAWLRPYSAAPLRATMRTYGASDYAVTKHGGDYTVHIVIGVDPAGDLYLLDLYRERADAAEWVEALCDLVLRWRPMEWAEEVGQIRSGIGPFLDKRMHERGAYVVRRGFPTKGDKSARAQSIRGRLGQRGLYVPAGAPWLADFQDELLHFPVGVHDDQVDALGLIGQMLDTMRQGRVEHTARLHVVAGGAHSWMA